MNKFWMAAAAAAALTMAASASYASTTFTQIDQSLLDLNGTSSFGATIDTSGEFHHSFDFTTTGTNDASGSVVTIRTTDFLKDLDFTSIDLDGVAFTPAGGVAGAEPGETWNLFTAIIGAGSHTIHVNGIVVNTASPPNAASYGGLLNVSPVAVPEPATWALMIMGFGGAGAMIRSRRRPALARI